MIMYNSSLFLTVSFIFFRKKALYLHLTVVNKNESKPGLGEFKRV